MDDYAEWILEFDGACTTDKFKDVDLDRDLIDELYDEGLSVMDAIDRYLEEKPEHRA